MVERTTPKLRWDRKNKLGFGATVLHTNMAKGISYANT